MVRPYRRLACVGARAVPALALLPAFAAAGCGRTASPGATSALITANDNRVPAGVLDNDTLSTRLSGARGSGTSPMLD